MATFVGDDSSASARSDDEARVVEAEVDARRATQTPTRERLACLVCEIVVPASNVKRYFNQTLCLACVAAQRSRERILNRTKAAQKSDRQLLHNDPEEWAAQVRPFSKSIKEGNRGAALAAARLRVEDYAMASWPYCF